MGIVIFFLIGWSLIGIRAFFMSAYFQAKAEQDQMAYILILLALPAVAVASMVEAFLMLGVRNSGYSLFSRSGHYTGIALPEPGTAFFITILVWAVLAFFWLMGTVAYMRSYPRGLWNYPLMLVGASSQLGAFVIVAIYMAA
jgi:hypothetical protein